MRVYRQLVEDEAFAGHNLLRALREYFPPEVRGPFALDVERPLLRREIAATVVCNRILDGAGCTFFQGVQEATSVQMSPCSSSSAKRSGARRFISRRASRSLRPCAVASRERARARWNRPAAPASSASG